MKLRFALLLVVIGLAAAAFASPIQNGGFESCSAGVAANWSIEPVANTHILCTGSTSPGVTGITINPFAGNYMMEIAAVDPDGDFYQQNINTGAGPLTINFNYDLVYNDPSPTSGPDYFLVLWDNAVVFSAAADAPVNSGNQNTGWLVGQFTVDATAGSHQLTFCVDNNQNVNQPSCTTSFQGDTGANLYGFVDNVEVVPEPATFMLFGTGLIGIAAALRRKLNL